MVGWWADQTLPPITAISRQRKAPPKRAGPYTTRTRGSVSSAARQFRARGLVPKKKSPPNDGAKDDDGATGTLIQAPPFHVRRPTRPNWGGGKPLLGYNSLGYDALDPPSHARCAQPGPSLHQAGRALTRSAPCLKRKPRLPKKVGAELD